MYLDDILVLVHSKGAGKRAHLFCVPYWSALIYILIFPSLTFASFRPFSWGYVGILYTCQIFASDKLADIQQLALSLLQTQHVTVHRVMSFLGKANFVPMATPNCGTYTMSFRVTCYVFTILPLIYFCVLIFPFAPYVNWNG